MEHPDYTAAAKQVIEIALREPWMDDDTYSDYVATVFQKTGNTWDLIAEDIRKGVENGVSVEDQIKVVKSISVKYTDN